MNFISVCSGIEAASVAFRPLGWKAIAFSEIEPFPCAVLAHHYPETPNMGDMSKFREWPEELFVQADVIVGGPPCQAFSVAGLRNGLNDERGNLTLIYAEMINHADAVRFIHGKPPVIVLYENVPGLLSDKTGAYGCFLAALAGEGFPLEPEGGRWTDAGCVFGPKRAIAWRVLDAQYFQLAQRRRRVFVVASARDGFDPATVLFEWDGVRRDSPPSRGSREVAPTIPSRSSGGGGLGTDFDCDGGLICMAHGQGGAEVASERRTTLTCNHEAPIVVHGTQDPCVSTETAFALGRNNGGENVVVFSCKDDGGERVAMAFAQNSRDEVRLMNGDGQIVGALAAEPGMKPTCYVAQYSELEALYNKGFTTLKEGNASTQETHPGTLLRTLRQEVGEEAFAKWGLGILDSLQQAEVLRQALHGLSIRPASFSRSWVVHCALSRSENRSGWLLQSLREAGCERCASQGWQPPEQLARQLGAYLSELSRPGAQAARFVRDLWFASEGVGLLQQALLAVQEVGRPAGRQGQSVLRGSEGRGSEESEVVPSAGMQCEVSRERLLHEACTAGEARDSRKGTTEQERSGKGWVGETPFAVRRLTVEECEFLQGFPRGYTAIPWRNKPADLCPDGLRYKALGNSWAVPCVAWIGQRINNTLRIAA
jgi:DNA (cytosine-5)-methyltransferase 1